MSIPLSEFDKSQPNYYNIANCNDLANYWYNDTKDTRYKNPNFKKWLYLYEKYVFKINNGNSPWIWDEEIVEYPLFIYSEIALDLLKECSEYDNTAKKLYTIFYSMVKYNNFKWYMLLDEITI